MAYSVCISTSAKVHEEDEQVASCGHGAHLGGMFVVNVCQTHGLAYKDTCMGCINAHQ